MAVELLIRMTDGPGDRLAGNIVSVKAYPNAGWGLEEGLPNFAVIRIEPVTLAQMEQYRKRHDGFTDANRIMWKRRSQYRIDISALPVAARNALTDNGFYSFKKATDLIPAIVENAYVNMGTDEGPVG